MNRVYYNEWDKFAAQWLRNLIDTGHLPAGDVDERSIKDVTADDLAGYRQCHFFAGIGGWPLALRWAGVPLDRSVWTGSCPCQPFSSAGRGGHEGDERHLWPDFHRLIRDGRPATVFGEQVASSDGRNWLAGVRADLDLLGYAVGAADLCAAGVGAPHIRQRIYWVGVAHGARPLAGNPTAKTERYGRAPQSTSGPIGRLGPAPGGGDGAQPQPGGVAKGQDAGRVRGGRGSGEDDRGMAAAGRAGLPCDADTESDRTCRTPATGAAQGGAIGSGAHGRDGVALGDTVGAGLEGHARHGNDGDEPGRFDKDATGPTGPPGWHDFDIVRCVEPTRSGGQVEKWRRVEPGTLPLAHGVSGRVGRLRGYGNAIVPQLASEFIRASIEAIAETETASKAE